MILNTPWMNNVNINNFMHIEYYSREKFMHNINIKEIFSEGFLSLVVMLNICIFFVLSTEQRILCMN